jgi:hypothetical protein
MDQFGIVDLLRMRDEEGSYVIFWCVDKKGVIEAELAVKREWCVGDEEIEGQPRFTGAVALLKHISTQLSELLKHTLKKTQDNTETD